MGTWSRDRDVIALDPAVARDARLAARRAAAGTATVTPLGSVGGSVVAVATDGFDGPDFEEAGVDAGSVVVIDGSAYEVLERFDGRNLSLSRVRDFADSPGLTPSVTGEVAFEVIAFDGPRGDVQGRMLRMLGLEREASGAGVVLRRGGEPIAAAIVNARELSRAEALGTLEHLWRAAAGRAGGGGAAWERAEWYRLRFAAELRVAVARLDLTGDGVADEVRRFGAVWMERV